MKHYSIKGFKGLEAPVVVLWGVNPTIVEKHPEVLYVGMSRAKSELHIVGDDPRSYRRSPAAGQ